VKVREKKPRKLRMDTIPHFKPEEKPVFSVRGIWFVLCFSLML
jgi:hypothetical protein